MHGVLEHQRAIARTRYIAGITGDTAHGQRQARRAARSIDHNTFTGIDGEAQDVTHLVAAVLRQAHAVDHRHYSVHLHATGVADVVQYQGGVVADRIAQGAAVQLNGVAQGDAVAIDLAGDHAQAEYQRSAAGARQVRCVGNFTIIQHHFDTRRATRGVDHRGLAQVDGEVQILAGHVAAIGRHIDTDHRRCHAVDRVGFPDKPARDGIPSPIDNPGAGCIHAQPKGASTRHTADRHDVAGVVQVVDVGDGAIGAAGQYQREVSQVYPGNLFTECDGKLHHFATCWRGRAAQHGDYSRRLGIDPHARRTADVIQRQLHGIASRIGDAAAGRVQAGDADAVGVGITRLHRVLEHQAGTTVARYQRGVLGNPTHLQGQAR